MQRKEKRKLNKYNYRNKKRFLENQAAAKRWKEKSYRKRKGSIQVIHDDNMISNEPLTYQKAQRLKEQAENEKYHDYIQSQWDELNKEYFGKYH